jgi:hypothetical protein
LSVSLKVVRNEIAGWDVVREDEDVALSNHPDRAAAEAAAHQRADEEKLGRIDPGPVVIDTEHVHAIDDERQGVRPLSSRSAAC